MGAGRVLGDRGASSSGAKGKDLTARGCDASMSRFRHVEDGLGFLSTFGGQKKIPPDTNHFK